MDNPIPFLRLMRLTYLLLGYSYTAQIQHLSLILPVMGFEAEPVSTLTITWRHPSGARVGINLTKWWANY